VARGGAIGDFILTLPALAALRRRFPGAHLDLMAQPSIASLAVASGLARRILPLNSRALAPFFAPNSPLDPELATALAGYDFILSYLHDPEGVFAENVRRCTPAPMMTGPHRPDPSAGIHATDAWLEPLRQLGIENPDPVPRLDLPPSPNPCPGSRTSTLALHPGSGSEQKNWPESQWAKLLPRLAQACDWNLLLVGGEAEGNRLSRLAPLWPSHRLEIALSLPLPQLAARIASCRFFLGHDSGITHLAAALGLPGIALWGPTHPDLWRPRSVNFRLIHAPDSLASLEIESVLDALLPALAVA
jgi:ADP-heptose:LPS heptosyltransferase